MTSCLILGAGINGLLSALVLRQAGISVEILEQGDAGRESSWAGAGILSALLPWNYSEQVNALCLRGRELWPSWSSNFHHWSGIDPEYQACGMAVLDEPTDADALAWCAGHGEPVTVLPEELGKTLTHNDRALWLPAVAQVRNPRVAQALHRVAVDAGVAMHVATPATRLIREGARITGVDTPSRRFHADMVLVTAGAWSRELLADLGHAPDIRPMRGQIVLFKARPGLLPFVVYRRGQYLVPRLDGHILAGSTLEDVGFDKSTTSSARESLLDFAYDVMPALRDAEIVTQWAGLRPGSVGNLPTIDRHPELENLYINSGHFRYGVTMAPAAVEVLMHRMLGNSCSIDPVPYAWA
jgi:glycine oxidase